MSVEKKIQELLEESKKLSLEEQTEEEVAAEELTEEQLSEDQVEEGYAKKSMKEEDDCEDEDEDEEDVKMAKEGKKAMKEEITVDVSEDVAALVSGEELSEEFRTKAATIFEAAVITRVKTEIAKIEESYEARLNEQVEEIKEGLVEKVDGYLAYVVEQWMKDNELALERGMKSDLVENFIHGLKDLFVEHYVDIPEEKYDVLGEMETKVEELEQKLNESVAANIELTKTVGEFKRASIVAELSESMTDTEVEKFSKLAEEIAFEDAESFKAKLETIRESYFPKQAAKPATLSADDQPVEEKQLSESINAYVTALKKIK
jgi:hypothetical protein